MGCVHAHLSLGHPALNSEYYIRCIRGQSMIHSLVHEGGGDILFHQILNPDGLIELQFIKWREPDGEVAFLDGRDELLSFLRVFINVQDKKWIQPPGSEI